MVHLLASAQHTTVLPTVVTFNLATLIATSMAAAAMRHPVWSTALPLINMLSPPIIMPPDASHCQSSTGQAAVALPFATLWPINDSCPSALQDLESRGLKKKRPAKSKAPTVPSVGAVHSMQLCGALGKQAGKG